MTMTVFLSDLHIGTNAETNWYQLKTHENLVKSVLEFIQRNSDQVDDVVILGDWFEQWNYLPYSVVPNLKDFFIANPGLFARTKDKTDFISVMESIKGHLRFVNGDHDMLVQLRELNHLFSEITDSRVYPGHGNDLEKNPLANNYYLFDNVWAEHGNQHDLFNRPALNQENHCSPLPPGYFVARLYCHFLEKRMVSLHRRDASCIAGCSTMGAANPGIKMSSVLDELLRSVKNRRDCDLVKLIIDRLLEHNRSASIEFNLTRENLGIIDSDEVHDFYPGLMRTDNIFDCFHESEVAYSGLGYHARQHFCNNHLCRILIMGHTHRPIFEIIGAGSPRIFVNLGYMCPSEVDISNRDHLATFAVVKKTTGGGAEVCQKIVCGKDFSVIDGPSFAIY